MDSSKIIELVAIALLGGLCAVLANKRELLFLMTACDQSYQNFLEGKNREKRNRCYELCIKLWFGYWIWNTCFNWRINSFGAQCVINDRYHRFVGSRRKNWYDHFCLCWCSIRCRLSSRTSSSGGSIRNDANKLYGLTFSSRLSSRHWVQYFPAVAIASQHGFKKGAISFSATLLTLFIVKDLVHLT